MASSPITESRELISVDILVNGSQLKDTYQLESVTTEAVIDAIPCATFTLLLPNAADPNATFTASAGDEFAPGAEVEIKAGYNNKTTSIFRGIITGQGLEIRENQSARLLINCQDKAVKLTVGSQVRVFTDRLDSDIMSQLIEDHGLQSDVDATGYQFDQLLETGMTDWDFLLSRAAANGMLVYATEGKVSVKPPAASSAPELTLTNGMDVYAFTANLDASSQLKSVETAGWNPATEAFVTATGKEPTINKHGQPSGKKLAAAIGDPTALLLTTPPREQVELANLADGMLLRSRLAAMRGRVSFVGSAKAKLNTLIELDGFGTRFNGEALVSGVKHTIGAGNWRTETTFGLAPEQQKNLSPVASSTLGGLQNGVVKKISEDPDGKFRILVTIPVLSTEVWSRLSNGYAGNEYGLFVLPEVGDEVVVGFLNDNPRFAVVLGSLYSKLNPPPYEANAANTTKALLTKSRLRVELDDEKKIITVTTPKGNSVVLSDDEQSIILEDQNGNKVSLDSTGIKLSSPTNITIEAGEKLTLKGTTNIAATSSGGDISLRGINVTAAADLSITVRGGAEATLSADAQTTITGGMVMIN